MTDLAEISKIVFNAMSAEVDSIAATKDLIDENSFYQAAIAIMNANCIATCGCGHSGIACMHFAHSLCCVERSARFLSPSEALHGASGFLKKDDVMIFASRGGETDELFPIMDICKAKGVKIISVIENRGSKLAMLSDLVLGIKVVREADRDNCQGTSSFVATCSVFDALQSVIIELSDYGKNQFALIHPGGAVGKRLNKKEVGTDEKNP